MIQTKEGRSSKMMTWPWQIDNGGKRLKHAIEINGRLDQNGEKHRCQLGHTVYVTAMVDSEMDGIKYTTRDYQKEETIIRKLSETHTTEIQD